ncbi:origin recognition complex subunit 2 [Diutina catenulata]
MESTNSPRRKPDASPSKRGPVGLLSPQKRGPGRQGRWLSASPRLERSSSVGEEWPPRHFEEEVVAEQPSPSKRRKRRAVEPEEVVEVETVTTKRGRQVKKTKVVDSGSDDDDDFDQSHDTDAEEEEEEEEGDDIEEDDDDDDDVVLDEPEEVQPRRRGRPPKGTSKVGRPSRVDLAEVPSIFSQPSTPMEPASSFSPSPAKESFLETLKRASTPAEGSDELLATFDEQIRRATTDYMRAPVISGIAEHHEDSESLQHHKFTPLELPKTDAATGEVEEAWFDRNFTSEPAHEALRTLKTGKDKRKAPATVADVRAVYIEGAEGYFEQHSIRAVHSYHSVSSAPSIGYDVYNPAIEAESAMDAPQRKRLAATQRLQFHQWSFELSQQFSLCFYGVGSKRALLTEFVEDYLDGWLDNMFVGDATETEYLVVNGYNPKIKLKHVLQTVVDIFTAHVPKEERVKFPKHATETVPFLVKLIESQRTAVGRPRLVMLIHNIDGEGLRDDRNQTLLSRLAALPEIYVVASTDTINAPLLWDSARAKSFNWLWHNVTTYEPYSVELSFRDVVTLGHSKTFGGGSGAKYVLKSLSPSARGVYKIAVERQLAIMADKGAKTGALKCSMAFSDLFAECSAQMVVSSQLQFRTLLKEFLDHKMLKLVTDKSGDERIYIPYTIGEIQKLQSETA